LRGLARVRLGQEAEAQGDFEQCLKLDKKLQVALESQVKAVKQQMLTER
jgi:hypothetical protein